jgi:signal transduction histidine kinase
LLATTNKSLEINLPETGREYEVRMTYLTDQRKQKVGQILMLHDITERKQAARTLKQAKEAAEEAKQAAEEANRAKSTFLSNMSHEFRTPLNAIIGYSEMIYEDATDDGETLLAEDMQRIISSSHHLLNLINDVLDLSKIEAGHLELYLETFALQSLLDEVANIIQPAIVKNNNTLHYHPATNLGEVYNDYTRLKQVLLNLLSNAAKFTQNGTITLSAHSQTGPAGNQIQLIVQDTGIGISKEIQAKLFQPFSQADSSTTKRYGGTGLGLSISLRFCELMGGSISLESEVDVGSTFTVILPRRVPENKP